MKVDFLKEFGLSEEQIKAVQAESGKDVQAEKDKLTVTETKLAEKEKAFANISAEFEKLKSSNATTEDYKQKFEQLQKEIAGKEKADKEAKAQAEREANILSRYEAAAVSKEGKPLEWSHEAIKNDYLKKFSEALSNKDNEGRSDADIFYELTKDDGVAFKVPNAQNVFGGANNLSIDNLDEAKINAIMGIK